MTPLPWLSTFLLIAVSVSPRESMPQGTPAEHLNGPGTRSTHQNLSVKTSADPKAVISGFSLGDETEPAALPPGGDLKLRAGDPGVVIFFATEQPTSTSAEFRYRLTDYDASWTDTGQRIAHFRRLTPGHHRFEVQARVPGSSWETLPALISIDQQPYFYQTWYFYLLLLLCVGLLALQLLHQRDRLLKGQMGIILEERNRIASDCHDTLMAGFAAISWQLEATARLFRENESSSTPAALSCEVARNMVAHCQGEARRIIWNLRDQEEPTNILSQALSRAIATHSVGNGPDPRLEIDGEEIAIAPSAVHHLVCIGQEAITNAVRHAGASAIHVRLRYESESLILSIHDNGRGFQRKDTAGPVGHFGIPVMEERARKLGGALRLTSTAEAGTEVSISVQFRMINRLLHHQHHIVPWIGV